MYNTSVKRELYSVLRSSIKPLIIALGNPLRRDDGVGYYIYVELSKYRSIPIVYSQGLELCINLVSEFKPDTIIIIDGVDAGIKPGSIIFTCDISVVNEYYTPTTHRIPLHIIVDYLKKSTPTIKRVCILGVQVKDVSLGEGLSSEVEKAAKTIIKLLSILTTPNSNTKPHKHYLQ